MRENERKRCFRSLVAKLLVVMMVFTSLFVADPSKAEAASAKPAISKAAKTILVGKSIDLNVKNKIKGSTYKWTTSNTKVATVTSKGLVKGLEKGEVTITCTVKISKKTYVLTSKITVRKPAEKIIINNKITILAAGQSYDLNRTLFPASSNDKTVWTSSDKKIASPGGSGKFTALKAGTVTITATTLSGKTDTVNIKVTDNKGTVSTQEELEQLLKNGAEIITIKTNDTVTFTIPKGDYKNQTLVVDAPNADVVNKGVFKAVTIKQIKANTFYEQAIGNNLNVSAPHARIVVENGSSASLVVSGNNSEVALVNNGVVTGITLDTAAAVSISGTSTQAIPVVANSANATITTSIPLAMTCNQKITLVILPGAEGTTVQVASEEFIPVITGSSSIRVTVGTGANSRVVVVAPTAPTGNPSTTTTPTTTPTPSTLGTISGKVITYVVTGSAVAVSGGAVSGGAVSGGAVAVSGSSLVASGSSLVVSGSSILADATIRVLRYEGDVSAAMNAILTSPNTVIATTDELGTYSINNLTPGNYVVMISKAGYKILVQLTTVSQNASSVVNGSLIPLGSGETVENGYADGDIIDSLTGQKVNSDLTFTVQVYKNFNSVSDLVLTQTVSGSGFLFSLPEGYYTMKVIDDRTSQEGVTYATTTQNVVVLGGTVFSDQDIILSTVKAAGQATFVLTWGEYPEDLDSHLIGPVENDSAYHIYYGNQTYPENTEDISQLHLRLDLDDVDSYGPETTTIYKPVAGGIYTFYVHNFSKESNLVNSNAKVVVTTSAGTYTFDVPTNGTDELSWVVCTYNSATGEITPINQLIGDVNADGVPDEDNN